MRMRVARIALVAAALGLGRAAQGQCPLGQAATYQYDGQSAQLEIDVDEIASAPGYTEQVPMRVQPNQNCRLYITPPPAVSDFRVMLKATRFSTAAKSAVRVQLVSADPALDVRMDPTELVLDKATPASVAIRAQSPVAKEYPATLRVWDSQNRDTTFRIAILWAPPPVAGARTVVTNCASPICLYTGLESQVLITGLDPSELDFSRQVTLSARDNTNADLHTESVKLEQGQNGVFVRVTPANAAVQRYRLTLPLRTARLRINGASTDDYDTLQLAVAARVSAPPTQEIALWYADGGSTRERLSALRGSSRGIAVRIAPVDERMPLNVALQARTRYQLREAPMGGEGTLVAELWVEAVDPNRLGATGTVVPVASTAPRSGRDEPARLSIFAKGEDTDLRTYLTVLPPTSIDRYIVHRVQNETNGALNPLETVDVRLEGPAVGFLRQGTFAGREVTYLRSDGNDAVEIRMAVPRETGTVETLVMRDLDGAEVTKPIPIEQAQRPKPLGTFVTIEYRAKNRTRVRPFPPPGAELPISVPSFADVTLHFHDRGIDQADTLFGIQYVTLVFTLLHSDGSQIERKEQCVAIEPPPVGNRVYQPRGECTRLLTGFLRIGDVLGGPAERAIAGSELRITAIHDQKQYPSAHLDGETVLQLRRGGWFSAEPRLQLPTAMVAFQHGRLTPGLSYSGALFDLKFVAKKLGRQYGTQYLSFPVGFIIGTAPSEVRSGTMVGNFSLTGGGNYVIRNMAGNLSLEFFLGYVLPYDRGFRTRNAYGIFRPGFSVPISTGGGS